MLACLPVCLFAWIVQPTLKDHALLPPNPLQMSASAAAVAQAQQNASAFIARVRGQCDRPLTSIQMRMAVAAVAKAAVDVPSAHKFGAMTYAWCLAEKSRAARLKAREPPWYNTRSRTVKRKAKASRTRARLQCAASPPWFNTRSRVVKRMPFLTAI
jgi:hypothetical protein